MKRLALLILLCISLLCLHAQTAPHADGWLPKKELHLAYDLCGTLETDDMEALEQRLQAFSDSTSNQIAVIITPDFGGREIESFAFDLGEAWGVGQDEHSNGVVIVIKPKVGNANGEVEIATGLGLEGALPDIFCHRIITNEMIPHFQDEDYYGGIVAALDIIEPVCVGEYDYDQYRKADRRNSIIALLITFILVGSIIVFLVVAAKKGWIKSTPNDGTGGGYHGGGTHIGGFGGMGGGSTGGWSGGSSFGGFGGGHFGGGGASGRW
ncbi:MAG: TPM domain-containing protein [Bacteroidales bacterium]|nr:TPM domain-containing protein [Bacteroidales bacterium]